MFCAIIVFHFQVIDLQTGALLGPGKDGEICFKGPTVMKGRIWHVVTIIGIINYDTA